MKRASFPLFLTLAACNALIGIQTLPGDGGVADDAGVRPDATLADAAEAGPATGEAGADAADAGIDVADAADAASDHASSPGPAPCETDGDVCSVTHQCGCGAGVTCDGLTNPAGVECLKPGTATEGTLCAYDGTLCGLGLSCELVCHRFCYDDSDCKLAPFTRCISLTDDKGVPHDEWRICTAPCDPTDAKSCAANDGGPGMITNGLEMSCVPEDYGAAWIDCKPVARGGRGSCDNSLANCGAGYGCFEVDGGGSRVCRPWCKPSVGCGDAGTCEVVPWAVFDHVQYGQCVP
jgi:hypothetical protein